MPTSISRSACLLRQGPCRTSSYWTGIQLKRDCLLSLLSHVIQYLQLQSPALSHKEYQAWHRMKQLIQLYIFGIQNNFCKRDQGKYFLASKENDSKTVLRVRLSVDRRTRTHLRDQSRMDQGNEEPEVFKRPQDHNSRPQDQRARGTTGRSMSRGKMKIVFFDPTVSYCKYVV